MDENGYRINIVTKGNSKWEGFGSALKPAHEPIILARKPLSEKTIVENVLKWGCGSLDIDGTRIPTSDAPRVGNTEKSDSVGYGASSWQKSGTTPEQGRFPANIICTNDALNNGEITKGTQRTGKRSGKQSGTYGEYVGQDDVVMGHNDSGSKSRYFDIDCWGEKHGLLQFPKASKRERNEGCEGLPLKAGGSNVKGYTEDVARGLDRNRPIANHHPTVKPVHLMSWLVRLVSKEGDIVLDPFMGSGTTGVACKRLKRNYVGCELEPDYIKIAEARINAVVVPLL